MQLLRNMWCTDHICQADDLRDNCSAGYRGGLNHPQKLAGLTVANVDPDEALGSSSIHLISRGHETGCITSFDNGEPARITPTLHLHKHRGHGNLCDAGSVPRDRGSA